jgi:hypothetical protein
MKVLVLGVATALPACATTYDVAGAAKGITFAGGDGLPSGSVYSELGGVHHNHFARTENDPVVVEISGYGPTDTHHVDAANEPRSREKN